MNESRRYPDKLEIVPLGAIGEAAVFPPGSKSITNRALLLAAMNRGEQCVVANVLRSEDTEVMVGALVQLGFDAQAEWEQGYIRFRPVPGGSAIPAGHADLNLANSGTSMRFLTALVCLGRGRFRLDGNARMRERPIENLLSALRALGANARSDAANGCPPVTIEATGLNGGAVTVDGSMSSQFVSALLMAAPFADGEVSIEIADRLVSEPYVEMTVRMARDWGLTIESQGANRFRIPGRQVARRASYTVEPDASAASYWFAVAAICGTRIIVPDLNSRSLQGDIRFIDTLRKMGCEVRVGDYDSVVQGAPLRGIDIDMNAISDTVMTLAAVACFAEGPTTIRNVAHIRHKESDRIAAMATELRKVGAEVEEFPDGMKITPRPLHGAEIDTYNDHRIAMSMALIGLKVPGIVIKNPGCVAKTYPGFWEDLEKLRESR